jgi:ribosomal protein S8
MNKVQNTNEIKLKDDKKRFELQKFFRAYTQARKIKSLFFRYPFLTTNIIQILQCLEKESYIAGYHMNREKQSVTVFLNYEMSKNEPLRQKIVFFSIRGQKRVATVEMLRLFHYQYPYSLVILSTSTGLMTSKECLAKNCGGEFVVSIT